MMEVMNNIQIILSERGKEKLYNYKLTGDEKENSKY